MADTFKCTGLYIVQKDPIEQFLFKCCLLYGGSVLNHSAFKKNKKCICSHLSLLKCSKQFLRSTVESVLLPCTKHL